MIRLVFLLILIPGPLSMQAQVDMIAIHGKLWTENPKQPEAEAMAITGRRIVAVGATEEIRSPPSPQTKVLDIEGRRVTPGFNDAHVHFLWGGQALASVELRDVTSRQQFTHRIAEYARTRPAGKSGARERSQPTNGSMP